MGGWTTTRAETRYGCFLPDLTGLARRSSIANLPEPLSNHLPSLCKTPIGKLALEKSPRDFRVLGEPIQVFFGSGEGYGARRW